MALGGLRESVTMNIQAEATLDTSLRGLLPRELLLQTQNGDMRMPSHCNVFDQHAT